MAKRNPPQLSLFYAHVIRTQKYARIFVASIPMCKLSAKNHRMLARERNITNTTVHINTKVLKHIYDDHYKHHLEIITALDHIIRLPHFIYENDPERKGDYLFTKLVEGKMYGVVVDIIENQDATTAIEVRTCFYISTPKKYLKPFRKNGAKKYTLLWSREDGAPLHRNALDAT